MSVKLSNLNMKQGTWFPSWCHHIDGYRDCFPALWAVMVTAIFWVVLWVTHCTECFLLPTAVNRKIMGRLSFSCLSIVAVGQSLNLDGPGSWLWCTHAADRPCQCRTACSHLWRCGRSQSRRCRTGRRVGCWETPCERHWPLRWSGCCSSSVLSPRRRTWNLGCSSREFWLLLAAGSWLQPHLGCWCLGPRAQMPPAPSGHSGPGPPPRMHPGYSYRVTNDRRDRVWMLQMVSKVFLFKSANVKIISSSLLL